MNNFEQEKPKCIFCGRESVCYYNVDKFGFQPICLGDPYDGWKHSCAMEVWNNPAWGDEIKAAQKKANEYWLENSCDEHCDISILYSHCHIEDRPSWPCPRCGRPMKTNKLGNLPCHVCLHNHPEIWEERSKELELKASGSSLD